MRIEWAVGCRFVEVHDNLATLVGAGIDNMNVPAVPTNVGLMFAVRVAIGPNETGTHNVNAKILDPALTQVGGEATATFGLKGPQAHKQPGWEGHVILPFALQWPADQAGPYTICFSAAGTTYDVPLMISTP